MEPKIIFEDSEILVLDKPSGMIVNRADTTKGEVTVQDWVEQKIKDQRSKIKDTEETDVSKVPDGEKTFDAPDTFSSFDTFVARAGIVHRIDKETSGLLIAAKTLESFENLQLQFKERKVKKVYSALVHGKVEPAEGEVRVPVGRLPWNRKRFGVLAEGKEAVTKYKAISNFKFPISNEQMTFLDVYPETGRTHQIRVHMKYLNHPIFGDQFYAGRKTARDDRKFLQRFFLHAGKISFNHPKSQELISLESKLPTELQQLLDTLQ